MGMLSRVRESVRFNFRAVPLDHPTDWDDPRIVQAFFNSRIDIWDDNNEPCYPEGPQEHHWWIQNNSRYRFVFGPYWWSKRMDVKAMYRRMWHMKVSLLPDEERVDEAEAEDDGDSDIGSYDYDEGSDDGEEQPGTWDPYKPRG